MTRYPALVMALSWSAALTTAVVMFPEQPAVGAVAIAAAVPFFALAFLLRPALIALAVVAALLRSAGRSCRQSILQCRSAPPRSRAAPSS